MPQPSLLATFLATVLSFVLGGPWYGPVFGKTWMRLVGVTEATLGENFNPAKTYGITFVLAFLASYVFGMFLGENPSMALGLGAGAAAGTFFNCRRRGARRHPASAACRRKLMAYRVADACDHAERSAQPEIGRSDSSARLPSTRSGGVESAQAFRAAPRMSRRRSR
jgi:Protein of unknown function (DUF1761)